MALSVLVACLFLAMGLLDMRAARVMARIGARFQERLDRRVFCRGHAPADRCNRTTPPPSPPSAILRRCSGFGPRPVLLALFDVPWMPFFFAAIFMFHPYLGLLSVRGGVVLVIITVLNQRETKAPLTTRQQP